MSAKQAINDKLQSSAAACLRCGWVVNNQITKGLLLSLWVIFFNSVNIWQSYLQERDCLVHFLRLWAVCWLSAKSAWDNHVVTRTLSSYGDRTFAAAGPRLWNSLPVQLRNPDITYGLFRRQMKGHLFREAWARRLVTSDMRRHRKTLTYLHTHIHTQIYIAPKIVRTNLRRWNGIRRWYTRPKTVAHPSTNRTRRRLTSFMRRTPITTTSGRQPTVKYIIRPQLFAFIPDLKPSFSANPSHCSLSFSSSGLTTWFPDFYCYF